MKVQIPSGSPLVVGRGDHFCKVKQLGTFLLYLTILYCIRLINLVSWRIAAISYRTLGATHGQQH